MGLTALVVLGVWEPAVAEQFTSNLNGDQEVPPVVSLATGTAQLMLNASKDSLTYFIQLFGLDLDGTQTPSNLNDDVVAMHFHDAPTVSRITRLTEGVNKGSQNGPGPRAPA